MTGESTKAGSAGKTFLEVFIVVSILYFTCYKLFGFEVAILFTLCLLVGALMAGFVGVENIIIEKELG